MARSRMAAGVAAVVLGAASVAFAHVMIWPKELVELGLLARNPKAGTQIVSKVRQRFGDGSVSEWTGPPGDRRAGPVTRLRPADATPQAGAADAAIGDMLRTYDAAFNAKDLDALGRFYDPDVTIFEGGGVNNGWADYRDHHLGPELQAFTNLQFGRRNTRVRMFGTDAALVTSEYFLKAQMKGETIDAAGLETLLLGKRADGEWVIRHAHTSSRRRPAPPK